MGFLSVWERITSETELKKMIHLASFVGVSQAFVSKKKKENDFPIDWAFKIAQKYGLSTDWIMTGKEPKRFDDLQVTQMYDFPIMKEIDQWLKDLVVKEPYRREWFRGNFEDAFPMFKQWKKRREDHEGKSSDDSAKKIA